MNKIFFNYKFYEFLKSKKKNIFTECQKGAFLKNFYQIVSKLLIRFFCEKELYYYWKKILLGIHKKIFLIASQKVILIEKHFVSVKN